MSLKIAQRPDEIADLERLTFNDDGKLVAIGGWSCDLQKQTFSRFFEFEFHDELVEGVFYRDDSGAWKAEYRGLTQASRKK